MLNVNKGKQSEFVNNRKEEIYKKKKKNETKLAGSYLTGQTARQENAPTTKQANYP